MIQAASKRHVSLKGAHAVHKFPVSIYYRRLEQGLLGLDVESVLIIYYTLL